MKYVELRRTDVPLADWTWASAALARALRELNLTDEPVRICWAAPAGSVDRHLGVVHDSPSGLRGWFEGFHSTLGWEATPTIWLVRGRANAATVHHEAAHLMQRRRGYDGERSDLEAEAERLTARAYPSARDQVGVHDLVEARIATAWKVRDKARHSDALTALIESAKRACATARRTGRTADLNAAHAALDRVEAFKAQAAA